MKAHKNLPGWMQDAAREAGRKMANEQADDITSRAYNEMSIAMSQAGLSPRTINRVIRILTDAIIPKVDSFRKTPDRQPNNRVEVRAGDIYMRDYCDAHGISYFKCAWEADKDD